MPANITTTYIRRTKPIRIDQTKFAPAADAVAGEFFGYASTWMGRPDSYGDVFAKDAFTEALAYRDESGHDVSLLWSHDRSKPIGKWYKFEQDDHGLMGHGKITLDTTQGKDAYALLNDGALGLSVGFSIASGGTRMDGETRIIEKVAKLYEVSLVAMPANPNAKVVSAKSIPNTRKEFERLLRKSMGLSKREAARVAYGGYASLVRQEQNPSMDRVLSEIQKLNSLLDDRNK